MVNPQQIVMWIHQINIIIKGVVQYSLISITRVHMPLNGLKLTKNKLKLMYIIGIIKNKLRKREDLYQIILILDHGVTNITLDLY